MDTSPQEKAYQPTQTETYLLLVKRQRLVVLVGGIITIIALGVGCWFLSNQEVSDTNTFIEREPSSSDRLVYINQDWRFSFEYPSNGWKIREPAFGSASSLFNLAVWPEEENILDPVRINITPKWWVERVFETLDGDDRSPILIDSREGWSYPSFTMSVVPVMWYLTLIQDEYWVGISVQDKYQNELQMIVDSFKFHDPLPTLDDLDITPPTP